MREGAKKFIGHHDFRNFCKVSQILLLLLLSLSIISIVLLQYDTNDIATQSIKFDRTILDITIEPLDQKL